MCYNAVTSLTLALRYLESCIIVPHNRPLYQHIWRYEPTIGPEGATADHANRPTTPAAHCRASVKPGPAAELLSGRRSALQGLPGDRVSRRHAHRRSKSDAVHAEFRHSPHDRLPHRRPLLQGLQLVLEQTDAGAGELRPEQLHLDEQIRDARVGAGGANERHG